MSTTITTTTGRELRRHDETVPAGRTFAPVHRRLARAGVAVGLALLAVLGAATGASATFSPYVGKATVAFAAPANDCTASAGAHLRTDKQAQGEAEVYCSLRHARTEVSVRLVRWNGSAWVGQDWSTYTFNNSLGTRGAHIVTAPSRACGLTWWYTEVWARVTTGTQTNTVWFRNKEQPYDPCA